MNDRITEILRTLTKSHWQQTLFIGTLWSLSLLVGCSPLAPVTNLERHSLETEMLRLEVELLAHDSATLVLEDWCRNHRISEPPRLLAEPLDEGLEPPPKEVMAWLKATPKTLIFHRRVALRCGSAVLSMADNWYRPDALTSLMLNTLKTTRTPFGTVVKPLGFHRQVLYLKPLWILDQDPSSQKPLPPDLLFEITAVLRNQAGLPFSVVVERYTSNTLKLSPNHP